MKSRLRISFPKLIFVSIFLTIIANLPLFVQILHTGTSIDGLFSWTGQYLVTWSGGGCDSAAGIGGLCTEPVPSFQRVTTISDMVVWFVIFFAVGWCIMRINKRNVPNSGSKVRLVYDWLSRIYQANKFLFSIAVSGLLSIFYSIVNVILMAIPLLFYGFRDSYEPGMLFKTNCSLDGYGDSYTSCAVPTLSSSDIVFSFIIWFIIFIVLFYALTKIIAPNCKIIRKIKN